MKLLNIMKFPTFCLTALLTVLAGCQTTSNLKEKVAPQKSESSVPVAVVEKSPIAKSSERETTSTLEPKKSESSSSTPKIVAQKYTYSQPSQLETPLDCSGADSEVGRKECLAKDYAQADLEINRIYKEVLSQMSETERESLIDVQIEWIGYRDKTCDLETQGNQGGSGYRSFLNACLARVTRERSAELNKYLSK